LDEQISLLQDRLTQLQLRQRRSEERKRAITTQRERKAETRRCILVGALVRTKVADGELDADLLRRWLDAALTRPGDRALFGLPPL
jgi:hypothetical protein